MSNFFFYRRAAEAQRSMKVSLCFGTCVDFKHYLPNVVYQVAPPVSSQATNISFKDVVEKKVCEECL